MDNVDTSALLQLIKTLIQTDAHHATVAVPFAFNQLSTIAQAAYLVWFYTTLHVH